MNAEQQGQQQTVDTDDVEQQFQQQAKQLGVGR